MRTLSGQSGILEHVILRTAAVWTDDLATVAKTSLNSKRPCLVYIMLSIGDLSLQTPLGDLSLLCKKVSTLETSCLMIIGYLCELLVRKRSCVGRNVPIPQIRC